MTNGKHRCDRPELHPRYDPRWSGVSFAPHAPLSHKKCGEQAHDEGDCLYCPRCDEYISKDDCELFVEEDECDQ